MYPAAHSVAIIADDLTGACDTAVYFAEAGCRTYITLRPGDRPPPGWEVLAINTDSRSSRPEEAGARVRDACEYVRQLGTGKVIKKIDSMMRGNISAEITAAIDTLQPSITLLTPAFPTLGRSVRSGYLYIRGRADPIRIADHLPGLRCAIFKADTSANRNGQFVSTSETDILIPDSSNDDELRLAVGAAAGVESVLWSGSGALGRAIADVIFGARGRHAPSNATTSKPLLICAGSDHEVTVAQLRHMEAQKLAVFVNAASENYKHINGALREKQNVVLRLPRSYLNKEALKILAGAVQIDLCGGLVLTGGDTALQILDALNADAIHARAEILPGMPQGEIIGGIADGLLLVTKSGAFGEADAISRCIRALRI